MRSEVDGGGAGGGDGRGAWCLGQAPMGDPLKSVGRAIREAGAGRGTARRRLRGCLLWSRRLAQGGRGHEAPARRDRSAGGGPGSRHQAAPAMPPTGAAKGKPPAAETELWTLRRQYLAAQVAALRARVAMLQGKKLTFDEESKALYDAVAPTQTEADFERARGARGEAAWRRPAHRALRPLQDRVRHPADRAGPRLQGGDRRLPRAHAARTSSCRPRRSSPSSTSPTSPGAATTGTRATTAA